MKHLILLTFTLLALAACNKDDVITEDPGDDNTNGRPTTVNSSAFQSKVFEYTPAPGQFINETATGGFSGDESTPEAASAYALKRLTNRQFVSLGAFGGYIIVGFDHSIANTGGYDFAIEGNSIETSNEPGIVWVMQDSNDNGQPDDTWYELRGGETGLGTTIANYSVTYYRPTAPEQDVRWVDSLGDEGYVTYQKSYHRQPYYYPQWVDAESYTLTGTRLESLASVDASTGQWTNPPYSWGYADNLGSDLLPTGAAGVSGPAVGFKISNAIDSNGRAVVLPYIDFIKVQSGVLSTSGWLGENSCEVVSFIDLSLVGK